MITLDEQIRALQEIVSIPDERLASHAMFTAILDTLRSVKQAEPVASPIAQPDKTDWRDWLPEARVRAAQCWCEPETSGIEMDVRLAEAVAKAIAGWMQEAAQYAKNADYWRTLCSASAPAAPQSPKGADQRGKE
jgi:hypothetical protein